MTIFAMLIDKVMVNKTIEISVKRPNGNVQFGACISLEEFKEIDFIAFSEGLLSCMPECKLCIEISNADYEFPF